MSEVEEDKCDICVVLLDECECVECEHCGNKEEAHEMYQGRCRSCEDEQMVRSIW